jgi:molecular chaperone DnaJ
MSNKKDYYDILGIKRTAADDEIKKAYRDLARAHHPDMVADSDKADAEKRFKEINEAYQVLKDSKKRKQYDQFGHSGPGFNPGSGGSQANWGPFSYSYGSSSGGASGVDPFEIFEEFFGGGFGRRRPRKGKNLYYEIHLKFEEALLGLEKEIQTESGKLKIKIPKGSRDGIEIRFAGKGMPGPSKDIPNGDLYLTIRTNSPKEFDIHGDDILVVKEIDYVTAILGGTIDIPVINIDKTGCIDSSTLKIPAGTQFGTKFRVRGKGLPRLRSTGHGDVFVQVLVAIPKSVSRKEKKKLQEIKDLK